MVVHPLHIENALTMMEQATAELFPTKRKSKHIRTTPSRHHESTVMSGGALRRAGLSVLLIIIGCQLTDAVANTNTIPDERRNNAMTTQSLQQPENKQPPALFSNIRSVFDLLHGEEQSNNNLEKGITSTKKSAASSLRGKNDSQRKLQLTQSTPRPSSAHKPGSKPAAHKPASTSAAHEPASPATRPGQHPTAPGGAGRGGHDGAHTNSTLPQPVSKRVGTPLKAAGTRPPAANSGVPHNTGRQPPVQDPLTISAPAKKSGSKALVIPEGFELIEEIDTAAPSYNELPVAEYQEEREDFWETYAPTGENIDPLADPYDPSEESTWYEDPAETEATGEPLPTYNDRDYDESEQEEYDPLENMDGLEDSEAEYTPPDYTEPLSTEPKDSEIQAEPREKESTLAPTKPAYNPPVDETGSPNGNLTPEETEDLEELEEELEVKEEELEQEEREVRRIGGFGGFLAVLAMVFTAYQMSENPDGIYASFCRLTITLSGCAVKMMFMPFRSAASGSGGGGGGGRRGYGHIPTGGADYGYRDPYRPGVSNGGGSVELS